METEFFGYRKGAFTGADDDRDGFFQAAARRHAVPRRGRRPAAGDAGRSCCARSRSARVRRSARPPRSRSTCASSARRTRTSALSAGRPVPPGPLLPPQRDRAPRAAAARAPRGHAGARERVLERLARDAGVGRRRACRATRSAHLSRYRSRATCASSRICSSARSRCRATRCSMSTTWGCPSRCSTDSAAPELDLIADRRRGRGRIRARRRADGADRGAAAERPRRAYLDERRARHPRARARAPRFNRTAAAISLGISFRQLRYRMQRLDVNVGGDAGGAERE